MAQTIIHVVRHGEVHNPEGILYGRLPGYHLSDLGIQMAHRVGEFLSNRNIVHLRCSPLERAQETMAKIARFYPGLSVVLDDNLIEADNALAGQVFGPSNKALKNPKNWLLYRNPIKPSWGEPYRDISSRMLTGLWSAYDQAQQDSATDCPEAVIVSHQLPIWVLRLTLQGRRLWHDPRARQCTLASVTSFHFVDRILDHIDYAEPALDLIPPKDRRDVFSAGNNTNN